MGELVQEIVNMSIAYFAGLDEDFSSEYITLIANSSIDEYKAHRAYPPYYTDEMIEKDVLRYFTLHKSYIAMQVIPEIYGRMGGEGLAMLTDAGTTRMWKNSTLFNDVVPICEVV